MEISTVTNRTGTNATNSTSNDATAATVDYNCFLQLLIAQMKNQDPTKPIDSTQFMAQLASFSNVEQGIKINQKLDSMMTSMALSQADGIVGRTIISADGNVAGKVHGSARGFRRRRCHPGEWPRGHPRSRRHDRIKP